PTTPPPSPTPVRPEAVPTVPPGPTPPGVTPPPAAKEEEPAPPPLQPVAEPRLVPEGLLPSRAPTLVPPPVFVGPNLLNPPAPQGWLTITPSFTLGVAYDDNIFLDSRNRKSDFIIGLTPGVTAAIRRPGFNLLAGYNVSGQVFVKETDLSAFGKEQNFF